MNSFKPNPGRQCVPRRSAIAKAAAALLAGAAASALHAAPITVDNPDLKIRFDNAIKYSQAYRLLDASPGLTTCAACLNQDDGNNNFGTGLVSNRIDLLSEFDVTYRNFGMRVSGAAWYDAKYQSSNDNTSFTANHIPRNEFAEGTRTLMGKKAELLDAFIFGKAVFGEMPATFRLGRHTVLYGESLFFGANGIAGGQAPVDLVKLLSVPNAQFKETAMPTGKLSGQVQISADLSLGGYYQYDWRKTRLMPVGAFLSGSDAMGDGAERIIAGNPAAPNPPAFIAQADQQPRQGGQYGAQVKVRASSIDTDFGFYATRYHSTTPANIYNTLTGVPPALRPASYQWTYAEDIRAFGASFAKAVGEVSLSGEVSVRRNTPLSSSGQSILSTIGVNVGINNNTRPAYAIGETAHAQVSWLASLGPSFISSEASFLGEVAFNRITSITRNAGMLNPNADRNATSLRMVYSPTYRQLFPGLDVSVPVGVSHTRGRSGALGPGFGVHRGGDMNAGLSATYLNGWTVAANYVRFYGPEGTTLDAANNAQFKQALRDRDYISLSIRNTF
jgi:hypothetical protein